MTLTLALSCIAGQLAISVLAIASGRSPVTMRIVYGASVAASLLLLAIAANHVRQHESDRFSMRDPVRGSQRIGQRMNRSEHGIFNRQSGEAGAELHGPAGG